jgi:hypothetical protein
MEIDSIVSESRGNESVEIVCLYPISNDGIDYEFWDKIGQAVGNLQALKTLHLSTENYHEDDEGENHTFIADWEIVARILSHIRQKVKLDLGNDLEEDYRWGAEESRSFARVIHGHPTITHFEDTGGMFPYEACDALYSALATLPALESIVLCNRELDRHGRVSDLAVPGSLGRLLRVPSLRSVYFYHFYFTRALCQATAKALMEDTAVTELDFCECIFSTWQFAVLVGNGLSKNTSVKSIKVASPFDEVL